MNRAFFVLTVMVSAALRYSRTPLPSFRLPWLRQRYAATILPTFLASQTPFNWTIPSWQSLLELFPPFLLAVPKKKVSHSRKAMRSAGKGLKDKKSLYCVCANLLITSNQNIKILSIVKLAVNQNWHITYATRASLY